MGFLKDFGIVGWEGIEPLVYLALMRRRPILFIGKKGSFKTEASKILANMMLNGGFVAEYNTPLLQIDDLLGLLNPKTLGNKNEDGTEVVDYIHTPNSIWNAKAVIFDEINRADRSTANKLLEIVRTRKAMGKSTAIKYVFATANPPKGYDAQYLDVAFASRFMFVQVPSAKDLIKSDRQAAVHQIHSSNNKGVKNASKIRHLIIKARNEQVPDQIQLEASECACKIIEDVNSEDVEISVRQGQYIALALVDLMRLKSVGLVKRIDAGILTKVVMAFIPEANDVIRSKDVKGTITTKISHIVSQLLSPDQESNGSTASIHDALDNEIIDEESWVGNLLDSIEGTNDPSSLRLVIKKTRKLLSNENLTEDSFNSISDSVIAKLLNIEKFTHKTKVSFTKSDLMVVIKTIVDGV